MERDNATIVLSRFIDALKIPVTCQSVSDELEKHPDYNSLLAFSDVLDRWQVPNAAYTLQYEQLADAPLPFIALINRKEFAVITQLNENIQQCFHTSVGAIKHLP